MPDAKQIMAQWWASLSEFRADIAAAKGEGALIEKACAAEVARADYLLAAVESVTQMTPQEAAEMLDLALQDGENKTRPHNRDRSTL